MIEESAAFAAETRRDLGQPDSGLHRFDLADLRRNVRADSGLMPTWRFYVNGGMALSELLATHPDVSRRTAQRWIARLMSDGRVAALGKGRACRYLPTDAMVSAPSRGEEDAFPDHIPLSADSREILAYVNRALEARKPIGYQREFLDDYQPNRTWYLSEPLRRQLRKMGDTGQAGLPRPEPMDEPSWTGC